LLNPPCLALCSLHDPGLRGLPHRHDEQETANRRPRQSRQLWALLHEGRQLIL